MRVNIISNNNGYGLSRNPKLLGPVLEAAGFEVTINPIQYHSVMKTKYPGGVKREAVKLRDRLRGVAKRWSRRLGVGTVYKPAYDVNLFFEFIVPEWLPYARVNCLIPNQEWMRDDQQRYLKQIDLVLCKSRHAEEKFKSAGCKTEYISFTSMDRGMGEGRGSGDVFFHLSGGGGDLRGTGPLIDLWERHPDWPVLRIVQRESHRPVSAKNIDYMIGYIDDGVLRGYQNASGVHLCPTTVEGFGHSIVEGMSCGAVVLTTDGPPMNEMVTGERGVLVGYNRTEPMRWGTRYFVDGADLERKVEGLLGMDLVTRERMGALGQAWYEENDRFFKRRVVEVVGGL